MVMAHRDAVLMIGCLLLILAGALLALVLPYLLLAFLALCALRIIYLSIKRKCTQTSIN